MSFYSTKQGKRVSKKYFFFSAILFCIYSTLSVSALADQPKNFEAIYKAKINGISITATRKLETLENGNQKLTFIADSWIGDIIETSEFQWNQDVRVIPETYTYNRTGLGRNREAILKFNWENNQVINNVERKPWKMDVPDLALDKVSYQLQIRSDLINKIPLSTYNIADGGRLKQYDFEVLGEEELETRAGKFTAVRVKRIREESEDRQTIFWLAKDWDYLVIRVQQQEEDGASYEIDLREATLDGEKVKGH
ncbi:DUF3108 domain-containing protein [Aurantivibrio infirmus]